MEKTRLSKRPRVFYGYWVVVATFFCLLLVSGFGFFNFSLFVKPLEADFGWSRGGIMVAFTILNLAMGAASPFIGRIVDRYGARKVIFVGALIGSLGFVLLSQVSALWHFYVGWSVAGVGLAAMGIVPASAVVSNWFERKRGLAIGIMSAGIGAGGFVLAPVIGGYLIPDFGWRVAYLASASLTLGLIIPLALLVIKQKPADMGLYPDGIETPEAIAVSKSSLSASEGLTLKEALATSSFWLIVSSFLLSGFTQIGLAQTHIPYLQDIGFSEAVAAGALSSVGIGSLIGKLGFGWLCDRIQAKYVYSMGLGLQLVSIVILMSVGSASPLAVIWLYAIIMGLGLGSWLPTLSMLVSTNFGLVSYGTIFGTVSLAHSVGAAIGPLVAGYMYDITSKYHSAFIIFLVLSLVVVPVILLVRHPKMPPGFKGEVKGG